MITYITDKTDDGFLTAVFDAYRDINNIITSKNDVQLEFNTHTIFVQTDTQKAQRVKNKLNMIDSDAWSEIRLALRSCQDQKEQFCFLFIHQLIKAGHPIFNHLGDPIVLDFYKLRQQVTQEIHRQKGFLRFMETEDGIMYAPYSPDNDITDILVKHFASRLDSQPFVIHDIARKKAAVYNGKNWIICPADKAEISLSQYEEAFCDLWKRYYKSVNITDRPHQKQMLNYMPARYWKFLPEKQ